MRPLRIAHVDAERGFSGGEVQVLLLMDALQARGHENLLVSPADARARAEAAARGHALADAPMRGDLDLPSVLRLARALRGCDVAHLHTGRATWLGSLAARRAGVPAITTRRMDRRVKRGLKTRWIHGRGVARVAAISTGVRDCLLEGGVPEGMIVIVPDAVDPARVAPTRPRAEVRAEVDAADDELLVAVLGRLVRRKGVDVLLGALERLPRVGLLVVGDGPERAALEAQATPLGARVRFLGERRDVGDWLAAADVVAVPSRAEGMGVVALEALYAERPVVASAVGGLRDVVQDGETGILVPPEDVAALTGALANLATSAERRAALGRAGRAFVEARHLPDAMADAYEALYAELL